MSTREDIEYLLGRSSVHLRHICISCEAYLEYPVSAVPGGYAVPARKIISTLEAYLH